MELEFDHITTKGGDGGMTSLLGGDRRSKDELIFEVLGDVDELSSYMGLIRSTFNSRDHHIDGVDAEAVIRALLDIQRDLIVLGGQIAAVAPLVPRKVVSVEDVVKIELLEKEWISGLRITGFIIPGCHPLVAPIDLARTVARRAERHLVRYIRESWNSNLSVCQIYLNRLSDVLFVLARKVASGLGVDET